MNSETRKMKNIPKKKAAQRKAAKKFPAKKRAKVATTEAATNPADVVSSIRKRSSEKFLAGIDKFKVTHHQSVKLTHDYQAAEAGYGLSFKCDAQDLAEAKRFAERNVEASLAPKLEQLQSFLVERANSRLT